MSSKEDLSANQKGIGIKSGESERLVGGTHLMASVSYVTLRYRHTAPTLRSGIGYLQRRRICVTWPEVRTLLSFSSPSNPRALIIGRGFPFAAFFRVCFHGHEKLITINCLFKIYKIISLFFFKKINYF